MATKKTDDQVKAAMAKVEAAKAAEVAKTETVKTAATKTTAAKKTTTAKKAATEKKAPAAKTTTAKAATEKKAPAKKAATEKKAPAKKTVAKKTTQTVYVQCCGYEVTTDDIMAKVIEATGKKSVKELNVYVKPEEGMIYYTADGEQGSINL